MLSYPTAEIAEPDERPGIVRRFLGVAPVVGQRGLELSFGLVQLPDLQKHVDTAGVEVDHSLQRRYRSRNVVSYRVQLHQQQVSIDVVGEEFRAHLGRGQCLGHILPYDPVVDRLDRGLSSLGQLVEQSHRRLDGLLATSRLVRRCVGAEQPEVGHGELRIQLDGSLPVQRRALVIHLDRKRLGSIDVRAVRVLRSRQDLRDRQVRRLLDVMLRDLEITFELNRDSVGKLEYVIAGVYLLAEQLAATCLVD